MRLLFYYDLIIILVIVLRRSGSGRSGVYNFQVFFSGGRIKRRLMAEKKDKEGLENRFLRCVCVCV